MSGLLENVAPETGRPPAAGDAAAWAAAARGFGQLFWGIALGLLLFFDALNVAVLDLFGIPGYLVGCVLIIVGVWTLRRRAPAVARPPARWWLAALLPVYFAPFVAWWQRMPHVDYLILHLVGLGLAMVWLLAELTRHAGAVGGALGHGHFQLEARVCAGGIVFGAGLPLLAAALITGLHARAAGHGLYTEWFRLLFNSARWVQAAALLPFTVSMACLWRVRLLCLARVG